MKRILLVALMLVVAVPAVASAAPGDAVELELLGIQRGSIVEGTILFKAQASSAAGIKKLELFVGDTSIEVVEPSGIKQRAEIAHEWVTNFYEGTSELAANGTYEIKAHAVANGGADKTTIATVTVDNPAAPPANVQATPGEDGVGLTWDANAEPDLLGYQVERGDGTTYELVGETTDTFFTDPVGPGDYSYRVIAVRNSTARSTGRPSFPSAPVAASIAAPGSSNPNARGGSGPLGSVGGKAPATKGFKVRESSFAPRGLPGGVTLPGTTGLPSIPQAEAEWGTFEERLPYELPKGGVQLAATMPSDRSFLSWSVIPPDGLRWVAAGALMLALAALLRVVALRLDAAIAAPPELEL